MNHKMHQHRVSPSKLFLFALLACCLNSISASHAATPDASELVKNALDYWRSKTSYTEVSMKIQRPDWQRSMRMRSWTRGTDDALILFTSPAADAGNATLKLDQAMWMFTPKLNQVIKLPASMMTQSWMGSDFSYNDLARSDQIVNHYTHTLINTEQDDGHTVYTIESIPHADAPIVWGKEILRVRDDFILLEESFYDQDMQLVKRMITTRIGPLDGREFPLVMRMNDIEKPDHWTEITNETARFDLDLPGYLFTLSNLRNPRHWTPGTKQESASP